MKFCTKCGAELMDESVICVKCGCAVENSSLTQTESVESPRKSGLSTAAKVFMVLGTIIMALWTFCIGLAWCLPLTIIYFQKVNKGEPIGIGFKICSLLFVSTVGGILMLCDTDR